MKNFSFCIGILCLVACSSKPEAPESKRGLTIAQVGDKLINSFDFKRDIERIESKSSQVFSTHAQKKELLNELINVELLFQEALRQGYDRRLEFKTRMVDLFIDDLSARAGSQVTKEKVRDYYQARKKKFDQVLARHILIRTSDANRDQARKQIQKIYNQLQDDPSQFEKLARTMSQDATARQGGSLGYFRYAEMVEPFARAAFALEQPGEISPVVETRFGFHIIQLVDDRRGLKYHEKEIRKQLSTQKKEHLYNELLKELKEDKQIKVFEDQLLKMTKLPDVMTEDPKESIPEDINIHLEEKNRVTDKGRKKLEKEKK